MGTQRDHQAGKTTGRRWEHADLVTETQRGRAEAYGEMLEVLREKGPEGLADTVRRVCGVSR